MLQQPVPCEVRSNSLEPMSASSRFMRREMVDWSTPSVCEASRADLARATPKNTRRLSQSNWFMVVRPCFANMHSCMPIFTELNA